MTKLPHVVSWFISSSYSTSYWILIYFYFEGKPVQPVVWRFEWGELAIDRRSWKKRWFFFFWPVIGMSLNKGVSVCPSYIHMSMCVNALSVSGSFSTRDKRLIHPQNELKKIQNLFPFWSSYLTTYISRYVKGPISRLFLLPYELPVFSRYWEVSVIDVK